MLLDYGSSWLGEYGTRLQPLSRSGGAATLPDLLLLLFALQSDSQKPFYFCLFLFALQGFQNVRIPSVIELHCDDGSVFLHPIFFCFAVWHCWQCPPLVVYFITRSGGVRTSSRSRQGCFPESSREDGQPSTGEIAASRWVWGAVISLSGFPEK